MELDRRAVLRGTVGAATLCAFGATPAGAQTSQESDVTVSIDNVGAQSWEVTGVTGAQDVARTGESNPTLTLRPGTRYTIENGGWGTHPFALRDSADGTYGSDEVLLSQSGRGTFEDDGAVDWNDEGETLSFTLTEDLADAVDEYVCTVHSSMAGAVEIGEPAGPDYQNPGGSVSFESPSDGVAITSPVTFEMSVTDFVVEPASEGVQPGHGHLHILVDQPFVTPGEPIPASEGYNHYGDGSTEATLELDPGEHTVRVQAGDANHIAYDLTDEVTLTVEDGQLAQAAAEYDTSGDGTIGVTELGRAAVEFARGDISLTRLQSVASAFANR